MNPIRAAAAIAVLTVGNFSFAQAPMIGERGSIPPGSSQDGSRPADGAIKGGSILPGESGGVPDASAGASAPSERAISRCMELKGTLRADCLRRVEDASAGGMRFPDRVPPSVERDAGSVPPPILVKLVCRAELRRRAATTSPRQ